MSAETATSMDEDQTPDDQSQRPHRAQPVPSTMDPSPPREQPTGSSGYGPPGYSAYPYPPPHYPPPSQGYGPPAGGPYPPPHYYPPHYGYGHPPYGYPGYSGYPTQHVMPPKESPRQGQLKSPARKDLKPKTEISQQVQEDIQQERLRAAVEPIEVKPMRTDFHFFVKDKMESIQKEAQKECGSHASDKYILHSNMNARLLNEWIKTPTEDKAAYFSKEEEDRQRFMNDDEIASRHCATLTARARSPRGDSTKYEEGGGDDSDDDPKKRDAQDSDGQESPTKKIKTDAADGRENSDVT